MTTMTVDREVEREIENLPADTTNAYGEIPTAMVIHLSHAMNELSADDLASLACILATRAIARRQPIEYDEAEAAVARAVVSEMAETSPYKAIIQCRVAVRLMIEQSNLHPDQVRNMFLAVAYPLAEHSKLATVAIDLGIRDGLAYRKARATDGN